MAAEKVLGIIRDPGYGMRNFPGDKPGLWLTVYTSESTASLQCFWGDDADAIIAGAGVWDVHDLDGQPCWVSVDGLTVRWVGICKVPRGKGHGHGC